MFNKIPQAHIPRLLDRHANAVRLVAAGIQRKTLQEVEERAEKTTARSNWIAGIAAGAVVVQVIFEIVRLALGR
jgi:hypothetical protein